MAQMRSMWLLNYQLILYGSLDISVFILKGVAKNNWVNGIKMFIIYSNIYKIFQWLNKEVLKVALCNSEISCL